MVIQKINLLDAKKQLINIKILSLLKSNVNKIYIYYTNELTNEIFFIWLLVDS